MSATNLQILLDNEAATIAFATDLAMILQKGDFVALRGDLGAGKSTLARALIRTLAQDDELDVPSPTFSLMQHYQCGTLAVIHADLYRLSDEQEIEELGLGETLEQGVLLLEWPERAGERLPMPTFTLRLDYADHGRQLIIDIVPEAKERLCRSLEIRAFLNKHGKGEAKRYYLAGDASSRRYETILPHDEGQESYRGHSLSPEKNDVFIVMDGAQMHPSRTKAATHYARTVNLAQDVRPFVGMARLLKQHGFAAPQIFASDLERGLLLLEHLGCEGIVDAQGVPIKARYLAAAELLADIHDIAWPVETKWPDLSMKIPLYDGQTLYREAALLLEWYLPHHLGREVTDEMRQHYQQIWDGLIDKLQAAEQVLCLRDYHSPNLIWRENRRDHDKIGLIDFQDALIGPVAYDVASLAQDARITVTPALELAVIESYCQRRKARHEDFDEMGLRSIYPLAATQRVTKILGLFVRLNRRDGKPDYLAHLPRLVDYLKRNLRTPELGALENFFHIYDLI